MKWIFFVLAASVFMGTSAHSQKLAQEQVPVKVISAFEQKYSHVAVSWDREDTNYEANFKQDGRTMSVVIDKSGIIVETETDIPETDLPKLTQEYLKKNYPGVKIAEAASIVKSNGDINYEAEVHHKNLFFDANGKFIRELKD